MPAAFQRVLPTAARPEGPIADFNVQQLGFYAQDEWSPTDRASRSPAGSGWTCRSTTSRPRTRRWWPTRSCRSTPPTSPAATCCGRRGSGSTSIPGRRPDDRARRRGLLHRAAALRVALERVRQYRPRAGPLTCTGADRARRSRWTRPRSRPTCAGGARRVGGGPSPNYFVSDFKFPQTFRISLGADHRLPGGFVGTVDLLYSKNVNQLYVQDANLINRGLNAEGRFMYGTIGVGGTGPSLATPSRVAPTSGPDGISMPCSTPTPHSAGPSPAPIQIQKSFTNGFELNAGYTHSGLEGCHLAHEQPGVLQLPVRRGRRSARVA